MRHFHLLIHASARECERGPIVVVEGLNCETLLVPMHQQTEPLDVTFEHVCQQLEQFERMYIEPDGSFVWVSGNESISEPWQVDGLLHDRGDWLVALELKGVCSRGAFERLLMAVGWPVAALSFQLVREAVFVTEETVRRLYFDSMHSV